MLMTLILNSNLLPIFAVLRVFSTYP